MDYSKTPLWMQDDLVKDIPREKLDFLSKLFAQGHGKSQKEMMALLMPAMRKAKQEHLTFTPQEMQAAITAIKNYSTCLLYTSPSPRDTERSRMPSSA